MKKIMICLIFICVMNFAAAQVDYYTYYKLNLDYNKGNINISSLEIEFSQEKIENFFGVYTAGVIDYDDEILNLTFFEVPNKVLWDGIDPGTGEIDRGGETELERISFELFIPYYENAKEIIIYDGNLSEVARKDVSEYSKEYEKISGIDKETSGEEAEKKKEIPKTETLTEKLAGYWRVLVIVFVGLILLLIYLLRKKKK